MWWVQVHVLHVMELCTAQAKALSLNTETSCQLPIVQLSLAGLLAQLNDMQLFWDEFLLEVN